MHYTLLICGKEYDATTEDETKVMEGKVRQNRKAGEIQES